MSDKPLVLTKPNVCAVLERRKRMTRRIINPQPKVCPLEHRAPAYPESILSHPDNFGGTLTKEQYVRYARFQVGDRAYVKEDYQITESTLNWVQGKYLADDKEFKVVLTSREHNLFIDRKFPYRKTLGRFMYKSLARIFLPIVEVRVKRVQNISKEDAKAEGVIVRNIGETYWRAFKTLWNSIHGKGAWNRNDWVFVYRWDEIIIKGE